MEKRFPQLYYIKMKISYDLGFIAIGVAMQRNDGGTEEKSTHTTHIRGGT